MVDLHPLTGRAPGNPLTARARWRVRWPDGLVCAALLTVAALVPRAVSAQEVWQFVDHDGVLHLGSSGATPSAADDKPVTTSAPDAPNFVAERGLTWINHTWRLRYPVDQPSAAGIAAPAPSVGAGLQGTGLRLPRGYDTMKPYLEAAARTHAVDPALVVAVAAAESAFNAEAVSHKGALGLMQIMPATAARYGVAGPAAPNQRHAVLEPQVNAAVGSRYLSDLLRMFGGDKTLALAAYNAGEGAVAKYGNRVPPYPETQQYVERVMRFYRSLTQ